MNIVDRLAKHIGTGEIVSPKLYAKGLIESLAKDELYLVPGHFDAVYPNGTIVKY